jgi:hypothetical protein
MTTKTNAAERKALDWVSAFSDPFRFKTAYRAVMPALEEKGLIVWCAEERKYIATDAGREVLETRFLTHGSNYRLV